MSNSGNMVANLIGKKYNRWTVLDKTPISGGKNRHVKYYVICDCGREGLVSSSALTRGESKSCGCLNQEKRKERVAKNSPRWLDKTRRIDDDGYVLIWYPEHPNSRRGLVREHTMVMSEKLGRPIRKNECIHHRNGIKTDNRIENLELWGKGHPIGYRIEDKIIWAVEFLQKYAPEKLKGDL